MPLSAHVNRGNGNIQCRLLDVEENEIIIEGQHHPCSRKYKLIRSVILRLSATVALGRYSRLNS